MSLLFFSRSDPLEKSFFRMAKWIFGLLGLWPLDPITWLTAVKIFINLSVLFTAIIGEIRFTWFIRRTPIEAFDAVCPCATKVVTWIKLACFVVYRSELASLLKQLYEHLFEDTFDSKKKSLITRVSSFTILWNMWLYFFGISSNCFYVLRPLVVWTYRHFIEQTSTWVGLPFKAALPYEDMTRLQDKTLYTLMYCLLSYSGNVTILGFPGVDGAFMCFCMYLTAAFQCLQEDFKQVLNSQSDCDMDWQSNKLVEYRVRLLVKRHQHILSMINRFNHVYRLMIFCHFLSAGIVLGIVSLNFLLTPGIQKTIFVTYGMGACSQLYTYCYGAEKLNESCLELCETVYSCDWYNYDKRTKRLLLFIMAKSRQGCLLKVPFFSPSLPLFAQIMKTSGSYITILQTFLN